MSVLDINNKLSFIEAVEKKTCLYDPSDPRYSDAESRRDAWKELSAVFNIDVISLKLRWKSIKDCYLKYKRARVTRDKQYLHWRWAPYCSFLDKVPKLPIYRRKFPKPTQRRIKNSQIQETIEIKTEPESIVQNSVQTIDNLTELTDNTTSYTEENPLSEVFIKNSNSSEEKNSKDEIFYLFASYEETFRRFSPRLRASLKVKLANLFYKAEINHLNQSEGNDTTVNTNDTFCSSDSE